MDTLILIYVLEFLYRKIENRCRKLKTKFVSWNIGKYVQANTDEFYKPLNFKKIVFERSIPL